MKIHIILVLFFIGCSSATKDKVLIPNDISLSYEIKLTDSLNVEVGESVYSSYPKHQIWNDSLFYGLTPAAEPNTISLFNLRSGKFLKKIKIDRNFFKSDISSFYVHNPDSIYFFSFQSKNIYLIDSNGEKLDEWEISFNVKNPFGETDFMFPTFVMYDSFYFDSKNNQIVCPIISQRFHELPGDNELPSIAVVDLNKEEIIKTLVPPIGKMRDRGDGFYPDDISVIQMTVLDGIVYASYPIDPIIYKYELATGKLLEASKAFIDEKELGFMPPMSYDFKKDRSKAWKYRLETPYFENLKYHSKSKVFSRIFHHLYQRGESGIDKGQFRTATIYLFDKNLNLLGKEVVNNSRLGVFGSVSTGDGYLSSPHDFYQKNENYLSHKYLYTIKSTKL